MPKIQVLYPRILGEGQERKHYGPGFHEVSESVAEHPYTKAQMKAGHVALLAEEKPEEAQKSDKPEKSGKSGK